MMKEILLLPGVVNVKSNIALKKIKQSTVLPLEHIVRPNPRKQRIEFARTA
jgi:hypothetical protein